MKGLKQPWQRTYMSVRQSEEFGLGGAFVVGPLEIVRFAHERRDRQALALEACFELPGAALANGLARAVGIGSRSRSSDFGSQGVVHRSGPIVRPFSDHPATCGRDTLVIAVAGPGDSS